jgi:hypothetical protein
VKNKQAIKDKLFDMESQLGPFVEEHTTNEDDAMHAASVLLKVAMMIYSQLLPPTEVRELLEMVGDGAEEIEENVRQAMAELDDEDDPFAGIDTTLKH